jgi:hypothetical protein
MTAGKYVEGPSFSLVNVNRDHREKSQKYLQEENIKVLDRIMNSKPSINLDQLVKFEKTVNERKRLLSN